MRRLHLAEVEDQPWCPAPVRDGATDYLQHVIERARPYDRIAARLAAALDASGSTDILDLGSGAGGPWGSLLERVTEARGGPVRLTLTDRYPNGTALSRLAEGSGGRVRVHPEPVDATRVPEGLGGFRTMFSAFHHFAPADAARILEDAVRRGEGIGIFEFTERRAVPMAGMLLSPLLVLLLTPAIRPFRWSRLFWTYAVPAIPLVGLVDGMVSCLRTYTPAELRAMTEPLRGFRWEIGQERVPGVPAPLTWLIGVPERPRPEPGER